MINIESINRQRGKISITLSVRPFDNFNFNHKIAVSTVDVLKILEEKRIKVLECIEEGFILNRREKTCKSTWVFKTPYNSKKKIKNNKKALDKSVEDVIIITEPKDLEEIKDLEDTKKTEE